jgi:uncharacterized membrane protein YphA (DoxX/SURF4 family)
MKFLDHPVIPVLGRLLMVYIFATSGLAKVFGWQANIEYDLPDYRLPSSQVSPRRSGPYSGTDE